MRHVGKGQVVTARYERDEAFEVAGKGDLFGVHDMRIDARLGVLYVGFYGGLSGDAGYVIQYDLKRKRMLAELSVESNELRGCGRL
jgi:hypothetical protein